MTQLAFPAKKLNSKWINYSFTLLTRHRQHNNINYVYQPESMEAKSITKLKRKFPRVQKRYTRVFPRFQCSNSFRIFASDATQTTESLNRKPIPKLSVSDTLLSHQMHIKWRMSTYFPCFRCFKPINACDIRLVYPPSGKQLRNNRRCWVEMHEAQAHQKIDLSIEAFMT